MDPMEQSLLRLRELRPEVPFWAKAEQMEISVPQIELWKYSATAIFGKWKSSNVRDYATINELTVLSNLETHNAQMIREGKA